MEKISFRYLFDTTLGKNSQIFFFFFFFNVQAKKKVKFLLFHADHVQ